ncbi:MAG: BlaI/MecI/CopY family transcriptional regulator [Candidatus Verstraetearchaeota archaeon]|jgi:Fe2+ or Zn2+ uptake regulation protein|nr:BlaI/MecI/CopY family transcriptional regulator [Candidatus Verstraetearchaeota archaeon]
MRKLKIEFSNKNGNKITIICNGNLPKEQILKLIELFENSSETKSQFTRTTLRERILDLILNEFNNIWFTSKDIIDAYIKKYNESIKPSTISTYLSRLYDNGYLERIRDKKHWKYKLISKTSTKNIESYTEKLCDEDI